MDQDIKVSLLKELGKESNEETTIQIRLFDDRTARVFYKHLTQKELETIIGIWDKMQWG